MSQEWMAVVEVVKAVASVSVPFVLVWAAHRLQRKQRSFEAVMGEKVRHYGNLSPLLNLIYSYRFRVGDFLDRPPETVLEAKRRADQEFWTFEYLWGDDFRRAYHQFMRDGFSVFGPEGSKARIRVDGNLYPVKSSTPGWEAFSGEPVDRTALGKLYAELKTAIARDLGFDAYTTKMG